MPEKESLLLSEEGTRLGVCTKLAVNRLNYNVDPGHPDQPDNKDSE